MKLKVIFGMLTAALVAAPSAFAASAQHMYNGIEGDVQTQVQATNHAATVSSAGSLPFTGLDLMLLVGGGLLLLLTGIALYLVSRPRASA